jgi:hypothetical protein
MLGPDKWIPMAFNCTAVFSTQFGELLEELATSNSVGDGGSAQPSANA